MSARKAEPTAASEHFTVQARQTRLSLSPDAYVIHKRGIEFRSAVPFAAWSEMTVTLQSHHNGTKVHCTGVVISCTGNRHSGYHASMVFTGMSKQAEARLNALAFSLS